MLEGSKLTKPAFAHYEELWAAFRVTMLDKLKSCRAAAPNRLTGRIVIVDFQMP